MNIEKRKHTFPAEERCQCCKPHHKPTECQRDFQEDTKPQPTTATEKKSKANLVASRGTNIQLVLI